MISEKLRQKRQVKGQRGNCVRIFDRIIKFYYSFHVMMLYNLISKKMSIKSPNKETVVYADSVFLNALLEV